MSDDDEERKGRKDRKASVFFAGLAAFAFPIGLAVVFLAFHLPYSPASLEDLDSINFALGIRAFDVAHHQPHPPGYPVFILLAKAVHALGPAEAAALALVSIVAGALGVVAIAALFRRLEGAAASPPWTAAATAAAMTAPLYWFTAARPLSDTAGLAAAIAVQAFTLSATTTRSLAAAAFCAGLATGLRSQVAWLTLPLLILKGLGAGGWGLAEGSGQLAPRPKSLGPVMGAFVTGALLWFAPLVITTGGPSAYWRALFDQGAEDLGNIQMLWNNHGIRDLREAAYYSFIAPWAAWPLAVVVLICAAAGLQRLARGARTALAVLAAAFGPYLVFDLLFQETFTGRYALPLVVPIAYLAISGLRALPRGIGLAAAVALAMFGAHIGGTSIAAYSRAPAPAFQLLDAMRAVPPIEGAEPVLAPDRRLSFDLRRPLKWIGESRPPFTHVLATPPQHEWLEAVRYWNGGGRGPVWFVVDPKRASIDLVQHGEPQRFRWPLAYPELLSGARPGEMDWYRVDRPDWYLGEGWALTPEAAGVAEADRRGPSLVPASAWVTGRALGGTVMIGGRNLGSKDARIDLSIDASDQRMPEIIAPPGPFLAFLNVPAGRRDAEYLRLSVSAPRDSRVALEQFDVQPLNGDRPVFGFGAGWHEAELNPATGARWRWLSKRGELAVRGTGRAATLRLEGESPRAYFSRGSRLTIRAGEQVVFDQTLTGEFSLTVPIPAGSPAIVLETDQTYVPAERSSRTQDRRRLGLRLFKVAVF